jgi:Uma2 family endonuclease
MLISTKYTHADLLAIPYDGKRREIVDGEMVVSPSPSLTHQRVLRSLAYALMKYLEANPIGEVFVAPLDVILGELDVLEPDIFFVLNEHRPILRDWVRGAPDLVVEILSPTTAANDRGPKLKAYARHQVPEYWIVDPESCTLEVYRLAQNGYELTRIFSVEEALTSTLLPGFSVALGSLFLER